METLPPLEASVVLGVAAHPDDLDFMAAGTVARYAAAGADCYYLILTDGSAGSDDRTISRSQLSRKRRAEQQAAGRILGIKDVFFCNYIDGMLEPTRQVRCDVCRVIRRVRPNIVITVDPTVLFVPALGFINHPDHRAAGLATIDAVFPLARDHLSFPELVDEGLEPHKTAHMLLSNLATPNFAIDISDTLDRKCEALAAHTSQIKNREATREWVTSRAVAAGRQYGYDFAESFVRIDISA